MPVTPTPAPILSWEVRPIGRPDGGPEPAIPATVPGAVQLDWARAHDWPPYWYADEYRRYGWMEDTAWRYQAALDLSGIPAGQHVWFLCEGIDYRWTIRLGERELETREGMFSPIAIDLTAAGARDGDLLVVEIAPVPKQHRKGEDRWQADRSCKPPCSYGWDWHPRLVPSGIWDEARLVVTPGNQRIAGTDLDYRLDPAARRAAITATARIAGDASGCRVSCALLDPAGKEVHRASAEVRAGVAELRWDQSDLELWWPHDHGAQPRYRLLWELSRDDEPLDQAEHLVGFRRTRLVMNPEEWSRPEDFPKSRSHPPITLEINGRRIFAKGSNWVPPEIFPGRLDRARYEPQLRLARQSHFNLLRVWGGGVINKRAFYELCDELGIMVWTEFPLACLPYEDDDHYLAILEQEARAIIAKVRQHPCHVLWCGGNELFNSWSGMTDQSKALRLLGALCYRLDGDVPFLPTSPVAGMGHGHYVFRDTAGREVYQIFGEARNTAYTEFGCPGPASAELIREVIPPEQLWPPRPDSCWRDHSGFEAWVYYRDAWLCTGIIEHYFGRSETLEQLVERGQWLQSAGFTAIYEEARRQKPRCAMALNWCFNEPWPTVANNSLVSWPDRPKPALEAVGRACRPTCLSAAIPRFSWANGDRFAAPLWLLNDRHEASPAAEVEAELLIGDRRLPLLSWACPAGEPNSNLPGPTATVVLPAVAGAQAMELHLRCAAHPEWDQRYRLQYRGDRPAPLYGPDARRALNA